MRDYVKNFLTAVLALGLVGGVFANSPYRQGRKPDPVLYRQALAADLDAPLRPTRVERGVPLRYSLEVDDFVMSVGVARSRGGHFWTGWVAGEDDDNAVAIFARSEDGGKTFEGPSYIVDPGYSKSGIHVSAVVANIWADPSGRLFAFWTQSLGYYDGRAGSWFAVCENPDDASPTWSEARRIADGSSLNNPTVLKNGDWLLVCSLWPRHTMSIQHFGPPVIGTVGGFHPELAKDCGIHVYVSSDRGATWRRRGFVPDVEKAIFQEAMIAERDDGSLLMLFRYQDGLMACSSTDGGMTWSVPQPSGIRTTSARVYLARLGSGRFLLVCNANPHNPGTRSHLTAFLSEDGGTSWKGGLLLDAREPVTYPGGFQDADGTICIAYDHFRACGEIMLARFTEEDVLAGRVVSSVAQLRQPIVRSRTMRHSEPEFHATDGALAEGFARLKREAMQYVFDGYPVGPYYEAALPGRNAFCMRDTSHQAIGAEVLGLSAANKNMMKRFAASISPKRQYCGYWEIDRDGNPAEVDYRSDNDFWYNLPANFDLIDAWRRLWNFTGDQAYLDAPEFVRFRTLTFESFVRAWDADGDGLPDSPRSCNGRGLASYDESPVAMGEMKTGSDLPIIMARAYEDEGLTDEAAAVRRLIAERFTDPVRGIATGIGYDGKRLFDEREPVRGKELLYRGLVRGAAAKPYLDELVRNQDKAIIEWFSHFPEIFWRYGRRTDAMRTLRRAMDPALPRRTYPEASYAAVGAMATGLMGVDPDAATKRLATLCGLPDGDGGMVELDNLHVLGTVVRLRHEGTSKTVLQNYGGREIVWRARFRGTGPLTVDGAAREPQDETLDPSDETVRFVEIRVPAGGMSDVRAP